MWTGLIEVIDVFPDYAMQLSFYCNQQVIEAFSPHTSQEPFADRIGLWSAIGHLKDLN